MRHSITEVDFDKIHLTKEQKKSFKMMLSGKSVKLPNDTAYIFLDLLLAEDVSGDKNTYTLKITEIGKNYDAYLKDKTKDYILAGIKDWLALIISIIAIAVSIYK